MIYTVHEPLQSAYMIFHSTETALLTVINDIMLSLDKDENVFLVLLDLSARHLSSLTIPCYWHDCRNHLALEELSYNGLIIIFIKELSLLTSMRRILGYEIFLWEFPKVQFWDLYSSCIL